MNSNPSVRLDEWRQLPSTYSEWDEPLAAWIETLVRERDEITSAVDDASGNHQDHSDSDTGERTHDKARSESLWPIINSLRSSKRSPQRQDSIDRELPVSLVDDDKQFMALTRDNRQLTSASSSIPQVAQKRAASPITKEPRQEKRSRTDSFESQAVFQIQVKLNGDSQDSATEKINSALRDVLEDKAKYRALLDAQDADAQKLLDLLQMLLDYTSLEMRSSILMALLRLSKKTGLYPRCLTLSEVEKGSSAVTAGHFGEIWKGFVRGRAVCLKVVKVYQTSHVNHLLKAFSREAILWSHLTHPHLLPFYGIFHLDNTRTRICLVSPWMEKGNMNDYLNANTTSNRLQLVSDVAEGILYLHNGNIVHGDLKGANILITPAGRACLADFGLSTIMDSDILKWTSIESTAHQSGTTRWQAPELMDPENDDSRASKPSDIYAFACVCYEVFTGQVPFYEVLREATVILKVIRGERPSRPKEEASPPTSGLNDSLWELMENCWQGNPALRPDASSITEYFHTEGSTDAYKDEWEDLSAVRFRGAVYQSGGYFSEEDILSELQVLGNCQD